MNEVAETLLGVAEQLARAQTEEQPFRLSLVARAAIDLGDPERGRRLADAVAGSDPSVDRPHLFAMLRDTAKVEDMRARATTEFERREVAVAFELLGDPHEADRMAATITREPALLVAREAIGVAALIRRDLVRAAQISSELSTRHMGSMSYHERVAQLALACGDSERFEQLVRQFEADATALPPSDDSRMTELVRAAKLWVAGGRHDEALRVALPIAKKVRVSPYERWQLDLAQVLLASGESARGEKLQREFLSSLKADRRPFGLAKRAEALASVGDRDAEWVITDAERASPNTTVYRMLVPVCLVLDDVVRAVRFAARISPGREQIDAVLAIAKHCAERDTELSPEIRQALSAWKPEGA
jgi:hypothetical protein